MDLILADARSEGSVHYLNSNWVKSDLEQPLKNLVRFLSVLKYHSKLYCV